MCNEWCGFPSRRFAIKKVFWVNSRMFSCCPSFAKKSLSSKAVHQAFVVFNMLQYCWERPRTAYTTIADRKPDAVVYAALWTSRVIPSFETLRALLAAPCKIQGMRVWKWWSWIAMWAGENGSLLLILVPRLFKILKCNLDVHVTSRDYNRWTLYL